MSKTKQDMMENGTWYAPGDGAGLPKRRIRCCFCNNIIDNTKEPCSCGCQVFTCPTMDKGFKYCWADNKKIDYK